MDTGEAERIYELAEIGILDLAYDPNTVRIVMSKENFIKALQLGLNRFFDEQADKAGLKR